MPTQHSDLKLLGSSAAVITSELLFVLLPLVVIALIRLAGGHSLRELLAIPEWSFGSAVLIGQALVKLVSGVAAQRSPARWESLAFVVSVMVVLALVPSLIVLALMLTASTASTALITMQMLLFGMSVVVFYTAGSLGHRLLDRSAHE